MRTITLFALVTLLTGLTSSSCKKDDHHDPMIEGLTLENFPVIDGSTSTDPLIRLTAAKLLGYNYKWEIPDMLVTWELSTNLPTTFVEQYLKRSQTHGSIINLIDGGADLIFSARTLSTEEKAYADEAGVTLIETPIALDALVFIKHKDVKINTLSHNQLQEIYTARIKNWKDVGGKDLSIVPFVRNKNSGSQELMESLVMKEAISEGFYEEYYDDFQHVPSMYPLLTDVAHTEGGLGYTVFYYLTQIVRGGVFDDLTMIPVDGVAPDHRSIANRSYPFTAEVYLTIRSDLDQSSMAYKVYEYMKSPAGKPIITESGYVPY